MASGTTNFDIVNVPCLNGDVSRATYVSYKITIIDLGISTSNKK